MNRQFVPSIVLLTLLATAEVFGQAVDTKKASAAEPAYRKPDNLYAEAESYLSKRFAEFNRQKLAYDPKLEETIKQEQKEVAARNAAVLAARSDLNGTDYYYLGMLYHLAGNSRNALGSLLRFLANEPTGEKSQAARAAVVVQALREDSIDQAERAVDEYRQGKPQSLEELFAMEGLVAHALRQKRKFERMAIHAQRMWDVANQAEAHKMNPFKRDDMLMKAASFLIDAHVQAKKRRDAVAVMIKLRKQALALPSAKLFRMASLYLARTDPAAAQRQLDDMEVDATTFPPEIIGAEWVDRMPTKLSSLHGSVVLLDFWAPWCPPCRYTIPRLQKWHDSFKDKGLVVLGITNLFGFVEGRRVTSDEELDYLRDFKKKNQISYGFVIADSKANDLNYGVFSIPMSFLIDRGGRVRFISLGASETEFDALETMIRKLVDEPSRESTN